MIKELIQQKLNEINRLVFNSEDEFSYEFYQKSKSVFSGKVISEKLGLKESMLNEWEEALRQYYQNRDHNTKSRISCFRISLWLETICKNLNLSFALQKTISNEETAIKQVRALELIIRDVVNENLGGKVHVFKKLQELFKQDVVDKWMKSADETGVLSGTTFSELSSIFLDKNIFKSVEEIFEDSDIKLTKSSRDSLRYILEDIRLIRNAIAHNKKISPIQIEALNEYYKSIANIIKEANTNTINPDSYLDLDKTNMESFLSSLKEDNKTITKGINEIKEEIIDVKKDTGVLKNRSAIIIGGVLAILLISFSILFYVKKQSSSTNEMSDNIKDVKDIVTGNSELKNMSSTDDLTATKELNARTKDVNAKRLAIIYFDNSGDDPSIDKLKKGLADMLITDLSNISMLNIVERDKLEAILKEQKLSSSKQFDPNTAAKVGKLLGAQIILTGGYFEMMGSLRIDARFIDVESGKILKSDGVDGQMASFFKIQKQLSWKIIKNMDTKITDNEKKELSTIENSKSLSLDDLKEYSKALDLFDQGKKAESKKIADKLLVKYPDFMPIKNLLKKL
jgi:TolB-like protein